MKGLTKKQKDGWRTPDYLFEYAKMLTGQEMFDRDLCASEDNHLCYNYFTKDFSALENKWLSRRHKTGFCNPPYSNIKPFIDKAIKEAREGFESVFLIPTPNGEKIYQEIFAHADKIVFITGRIAFLHPVTGRPVSGASRGSCLVVFNKWSSQKFNPTVKMVNREDLKFWGYKQKTQN